MSGENSVAGIDSLKTSTYNPYLTMQNVNISPNDIGWQGYLDFVQKYDSLYTQNRAAQADTLRTQPNSSNITFGAENEIKNTQSKSSGWVGKTLGFLGTVALAGACYVGHRGDGVISAIRKGGAKGLRASLEKGWGAITKGVHSGKFTAHIIPGGKSAYYTGTGSTRVLEGSALNKTALGNIGLDDTVAKEINIKNIVNGEFEIGTNKIIVENGEITKYLKKSGKGYKEFEPSTDTLKEQLMNYFKDTTAGGVTPVKGAEFKDSTIEGVEKIFKHDGTEWKLTKVTTDRYTGDLDEIQAILNTDKGHRAELIRSGVDSKALLKAGMRPGEIERTIHTTKGDLTLVFNGDKVVGVRNGGKIISVADPYYQAAMGETQQKEIAKFIEKIQKNKLDDFTVNTWY